MIHTKGKTFTIERSKWLRGEGFLASDLLRAKDSKMCCLGQVCEQLGFVREELFGKSIPSNLSSTIEALTTHGTETELADQMMSVNDKEGVTESERESRLSELAQQAGFSLKFVD